MAMDPMAHIQIKMDVGREIPRAAAIDIIRKNQEEGLVLQASTIFYSRGYPRLSRMNLKFAILSV